MSTPRIATIPTSKPGRPREVRKKAEELIGTAGYAALMDADLFVVAGAMVRDLALILNEPIPPKPQDEIVALSSGSLTATKAEEAAT